MTHLFKPLQSVRKLRDLLNQHQSIEELPLDQAALALACPHTRQTDVCKVLESLDGYADQARALATDPSHPDSLLAGLRKVLFQVQGFSGNDRDYYHPDNSLLHRVIETKKGIPLSLSLVMIESARRLGIELIGIGLPCHFMVGYPNQHGTHYFDPFCGGVERTQIECVDFIRKLSGGSVELTFSDFEPVSKRVFLSRMLNNLRCIYRHRGEISKLTCVLEQLLLLNPTDCSLHAELAIQLAESGNPWEAHGHILAFLAEANDPQQGKHLMVQLEGLKNKLAVLN